MNGLKFRRTASIVMLVVLLFFTGFAIAVRADQDQTIPDDYANTRVGVQIGTTGEICVAEYEGKNGCELVRFNKAADAIQALNVNKLDLVVIDEQPAIEFVKKNAHLEILDKEFLSEDYAICVAKNNKELLEDLNRCIAELKNDGTIANIVSHYISGEGESYTSPEGIEYDGQIVMATNAEFPPYEFFSNGKIVGIDAEIATAIADKLGKKLVISNMEFASIIISVQSGKADFGMAGMTVTEDRKKNVSFTDSITTSKQVGIINTGVAVADDRSFFEELKDTLFSEGRWKYIVDGLINTLIITVCAGIIGVLIGLLLTVVRLAAILADEVSILVKILNVIVKVYITVFRGTPMMVQLLLMYYVVFGSTHINPVIVAIIAFALNSGAYVAEAIRAGVMATPRGQYEAGRSLGLSFGQTMRMVILPQGIKNALPAVFNEFIALLKESSIVGYIGLIDLTKAGDIIRSGTYSAFIPLVTVGLIYLVIVMIMTKGVSMLEGRLKKNAR